MSQRLNKGSWIITFVVILFTVVWFIYPFTWMCLSAFKENREIYNPLQLFPTFFNPHFISDLFTGEYINFKSAFTSSLIIAFTQAIGSVFIAVFTGYILARFRFPFKFLVFILSILVIIVPKQVLCIPLLEWMAYLDLNGGYASVIFPGLTSGLGIIFFMQVFRQVPREYIDLARVEGASDFRACLLLLPLISTALLTYGVIHFILAWHDHLVPLLLLEDSKRTLPLMLATLNDPSQRIPQAVTLAASTCTVLPVAILFGVCYRQFKSAMSEVLVH